MDRVTKKVVYILNWKADYKELGAGYGARLFLCPEREGVFMKKEGFSIRRCSHGPFDDSAIERLRCMGLISEKGEADKEAVAVLCCVYAGQLFDDLCDYYQSFKAVCDACRQPAQMETAEPAAWVATFLTFINFLLLIIALQ